MKLLSGDTRPHAGGHAKSSRASLTLLQPPSGRCWLDLPLSPLQPRRPAISRTRRVLERCHPRAARQLAQWQITSTTSIWCAVPERVLGPWLYAQALPAPLQHPFFSSAPQQLAKMFGSTFLAATPARHASSLSGKSLAQHRSGVRFRSVSWVAAGPSYSLPPDVAG
jgi:hypothetical protein